MRVIYGKEIEGQIEEVEQCINNIKRIEFKWSVVDGTNLLVYTQDCENPTWICCENVYCIDDK